jgi:long-chain acyl-CoA synthetase
VTTAKVYQRREDTGETVLRSGDYFRRDEGGFLYFLGRKDDMIKCRGERVSAKEVENILCELRGVLEAAVIGVPDEILGQAVKAFVVTDPESGITPQGILKHCSENVEMFMVPTQVELLAELPKTSHGKVDKLRLKYAGATAS